MSTILNLDSLQVHAGSFCECDDITRLDFYPGMVGRLIELDAYCGRISVSRLG
jgi:hypothetical protein